MRKRILLAWELGGGAGHLVILAQIAAALRKSGHTPIFALRRQNNLHLIAGAAEGCEIHAAPLWSEVFSRPREKPRRPASMANLLAAVGMHARAAVDAMLGRWQRLFDETRPDAIVADFSPACLIAARGRIPTLATGDPFTLPPAHLPAFPELDPDGLLPSVSEAAILDNVNESLRGFGGTQLNGLPQVFAADRYCVGTFPEIDPYHGLREIPVAGPWIPSWQAPSKTNGEEIFAYFSTRPKNLPALYMALSRVAASGIPVRVHASHMNDELEDWLTSQGLLVERTPVPFAQIHARSRLLVSHGSIGFASCALVAGIPHLIAPVNLHTNVSAIALAKLGTAVRTPAQGESPFEPALLAQAIFDAYGDEDMRTNARRHAPHFARQLEPRPAVVAAAYVEELL